MIDDDQILETMPGEVNVRRRNLIPKWIIVFCWLFMILGGFAVLGVLAGTLGLEFELSIYGVRTLYPLSITGLAITLLFLIKGLVGFGIWTEKSWAITVGIADAIIGLVICAATMILPYIFTQVNTSGFRLEIILLIPYLIRLRKIKSQWENDGTNSMQSF